CSTWDSSLSTLC
nr:immunoglobulin light chain junction region [Macaca mulatta]MPN69092.1 immunoglobulin light chain junction region [Macaca mulatta]